MKCFLEWLESVSSNIIVSDPNGKPIPFTTNRPGLSLVIINPIKLLPYYEVNQSFVARGNPNEIQNRINDFGNWLNTRTVPVEAPIAYFHFPKSTRNNFFKSKVPFNEKLVNQVFFDHGRHRFAWMVEQRWTQIPLAVPKNDVADFQRMFGI